MAPQGPRKGDFGRALGQAELQGEVRLCPVEAKARPGSVTTGGAPWGQGSRYEPGARDTASFEAVRLKVTRLAMTRDGQCF